MMKAIFLGTCLFILCFFACKSHPKKECVANPIVGCACTMQYDPVCGCDGKTYGNECEANCAQVQIISNGACKK